MKIRQRWEQTTLANKLMVITTAIVAFGTVFYVVVAIFQWRLMKESGEQASRQTDKLIAEARRIADTSNESTRQAKVALDATIDNFRLDQRAWVGPIHATPPAFTDGSIAVYVKEGSKTTLGVVITNSGKTPARKCKTKVGMKAIPASKPFTPTYPSGDSRPSTTVIQPGMAHSEQSPVWGGDNQRTLLMVSEMEIGFFVSMA